MIGNIMDNPVKNPVIVEYIWYEDIIQDLISGNLDAILYLGTDITLLRKMEHPLPN